MSEKVIFKYDGRLRLVTETDLHNAVKSAPDAKWLPEGKFAVTDGEGGWDYDYDRDEVVGPKGPKGAKGAKGDKGAPGESAYRAWLDEGHEGTRSDFLESLEGKRGRVGYPGEPGSTGAQGPAGADGGESVPQSATLTRDSNGAVETVTVAAEPTWTIVRGPDGRVQSLSNSVHSVEVDRDGDGRVEGITATEL
jgi:hypothetical protein